MYADVVVFGPVSGPGKPGGASATGDAFSYTVPAGLGAQATVGSLVIVPFGLRRLYGVITALGETPPPVSTKPVETLVDPLPVLLPVQIALARWMAERYLAPLHACLALMLPPGVVGYSDVLLEMEDEADLDDARTRPQQQLLETLDRRGALRGRQLDRVLPQDEWRRAADQLARRAVISKESFLAPPRARPLQVEMVRLLATDERVEALSRELDRTPYYRPILAFLQREGRPVDTSWVYAETGCQRRHLDRLAVLGLLAFEAEDVWRDPLADKTFVPDSAPDLGPDQQAAWEPVRTALGPDAVPAAFLLHGVTGSGKTEIYLRAVDEVLGQGRRAIVLVPEIALTPQTVHRFAARFPGRVAVFHSQLSEGERYDTWRRARAGELSVVVGPRSALFTPLPGLGLIVLDEEHDPSYKQQVRPYYHARDAAIQLGELTGCSVILGSATPSLESYHQARMGRLVLLSLPRRVVAHRRRLADLQARHHIPSTPYHPAPDGPAEACYLPLPPVDIVDMRAELRAGGRAVFSRALAEAMRSALARREQVILFLNRRGKSTFVMCRDCGYVARCERCDIPLTYHGQQSRLLCHHCGYQEDPPRHCPQCRSDEIRYFGLGTEGLEAAVREQFPGARTLRWDWDSATTHAAHAAILEHFTAGAADVLVGTQMVAKGLDLPFVTVVGVVSADTALNLPDFRSAERTFQLLAQVAGRAGRGLLGGRVILQTYAPDHYAIRTAAQHDYTAFAARELDFRRQLNYPPFGRLARLEYAHADAGLARSEAERLARILREELLRHEQPSGNLLGPTPAFFARERGRYRWQVLLRHADPAAFLRGVALPAGWRVDVDPLAVL